MSPPVPRSISEATQRDAVNVAKSSKSEVPAVSKVLNLAEAAALVRCPARTSPMSSTARFPGFRACQLCALAAVSFFGVNHSNCGFRKLNR